MATMKPARRPDERNVTPGDPDIAGGLPQTIGAPPAYHNISGNQTNRKSVASTGDNARFRNASGSILIHGFQSLRLPTGSGKVGRVSKRKVWSLLLVLPGGSGKAIGRNKQKPHTRYTARGHGPHGYSKR